MEGRSPPGQFLRDLKQQKSLEGVPSASQVTIATRRLCGELLWIAIDRSTLFQTLRRNKFFTWRGMKVLTLHPYWLFSA